MTADLHAPFLARIQHEPEFNGRLELTQGIYADWLEENGDDRAPLVRMGAKIRTISDMHWFRHDTPEGHLMQRYLLYGNVLNQRDASRLTDWVFVARLPQIDHGADHYRWDDRSPWSLRRW